MAWLNNVISDLQEKFFGGEEQIIAESSSLLRARETQTIKKVQQFQSRLIDLDRRLADLR